jgi:hypothetical protein
MRKVINSELLADDRIDISGLQSGIYLLRLEDDKGDFISKK